MSATVVFLAVAAMAGGGSLLAWWAGGPGGRPFEPGTPLRLLVLALVVLDVLGALILALQGSTGGPLLIGAGMLALGSGGWIAARWLGRPVVPPARSRPGPVRWWALGIAAALGCVALGWIVSRSGLPLLASSPQGSRTAFSGLTFDAFRWLVPPAALVVLAWALERPRSPRLVAAGITLGAVGGIEVLLASRALPLELGFGSLLIVWWAGYRPPLRVWAGLATAAGLLFLGVLFARLGPEATFRDPLDALAFAADRSVGRIVLIQPRTVDVAVTTIPAQEPFWGGATYLHRLGPIVGIADDHPTLGTWLYERLFPGAPPAFAAPGILAEGWVNGGVALAIALMLLLGFGTHAFGQALRRLGGSPVDRAAAATLTVAIVRTYATSLNGFLLTVGVTIAWWLVTRPDALGSVRRGPWARRLEAPWHEERQEPGVSR
jgi:hypothetical protein